MNDEKQDEKETPAAWISPRPDETTVNLLSLSAIVVLFKGYDRVPIRVTTGWDTMQALFENFDGPQTIYRNPKGMPTGGIPIYATDVDERGYDWPLGAVVIKWREPDDE